MKKILILSLSFLLIIPVFAQKRDITLDDLWKNYSFYPKSYSGLNSMNDGEHYVRVLILKYQRLEAILSVKMKNNFYWLQKPKEFIVTLANQCITFIIYSLIN